MYTDSELLRERNISQTGGNGAGWSAVDSLRRNAGLNKMAEDEVTPLLSSGGSSSEENDDNARRDSEWDGNADFEGLAWRQRPSVSCNQVLLRLYTNDCRSPGYYHHSSFSLWRLVAYSFQNSTSYFLLCAANTSLRGLSTTPHSPSHLFCSTLITLNVEYRRCSHWSRSSRYT